MPYKPMATLCQFFLNILKKKTPHQQFLRQKSWSLCSSSGPIHTTQPLISLAFLTSVVSPNCLQVFYLTLVFKSSQNLTELFNKVLYNENSTTRFTSLKFRPPSHLETDVVYKIPCEDCSLSYIGETGRCLQT